MLHRSGFSQESRITTSVVLWHLLQEQVTTQLWERLEKSPKGGVRGSEKVTHPHPRSSVRWTAPRKGEAGLSSCWGEPQRRAGGDIHGRLLPLHLVVGPESLFVSRVSSWEQEPAAEQEHEDQMGSTGSLRSVLTTIDFRVSWLLLHFCPPNLMQICLSFTASLDLSREWCSGK